MKMPADPPFQDPFSFLLSSKDKLGRVLAKVSSPTIQGRYRHWDKLLHLEPPEGLTREEWWAGLKFHRNPLYKQIYLLDKKGAPFKYAEVDPIPEHLHRMDMQAGGRIEMPEGVTNSQTRDEYYVSSLIEEAITSSQLEGAATTRQVAKEMIQSNRPPRDGSERMVLNNYLTMRRIGELKKEVLSPRMVMEIHRMISEGTLDNPAAAGRLRQDDNIFVSDVLDGTAYHVPPPASQLEERLHLMCEFANSDTPFIHPVLRSILLHFWLAYDHPFVDGNGRTARALFYWSMLHREYWLFEFISISHVIKRGPAKYARAFLYTETDGNDLTYFILYHLDVISRAMDSLHEYIRRKTQQIQAVDWNRLPPLNHRQQTLLAHALRHPNQRYTIEVHQHSHGVVYQTARTDLLTLAEKGFFTARKSAKTWQFTPAKNLADMLRGKI